MTSNQFNLEPIGSSAVLKGQVYNMLRDAITRMDIYSSAEPPRLDERRLAEELGVSRTPVREALSRLEQEGLVQNIPRRGTFVVRKTRKEILEVICLWAALESMAARLATQRASDREIARLRTMLDAYHDESEARAHIDEYSEQNVIFHQAIIALGKCDLIRTTADNQFIHMRSIRQRAIKEGDRAEKSVHDHEHIVEAIERRDADLAERLVREHALSLATHIETKATYLA